MQSHRGELVIGVSAASRLETLLAEAEQYYISTPKCLITCIIVEEIKNCQRTTLSVSQGWDFGCSPLSTCRNNGTAIWRHLFLCGTVRKNYDIVRRKQSFIVCMVGRDKKRTTKILPTMPPNDDDEYIKNGT